MEEISSHSGVSSPNLKEQVTRQVLQYVLYGKNSVQMVNTHETNIKSKLGNLNKKLFLSDLKYPAKTSVSPRSSPPGTFRETSPSAKSGEKRMFSQARFETPKTRYETMTATVDTIGTFRNTFTPHRKKL